MLAGKDEELRKYELMWTTATIKLDTISFPNVTPSAPGKEEKVITFIAQELVNGFEIGLTQAMKLAKDAVAAKGTDNQDEALGFAVELCKRVLCAEQKKKSATPATSDEEIKDA